MRALRSFHGEFLVLGLSILGGAGLAAGCGDSGDGSTFVAGGGDAGPVDTTGGDFGDGGGGMFAAQVDSLAIDPADATVTVDGTTPATASYTVKAKFPDGRVLTVSPQSIQFDRPDLAKFAGSAPVVLTAAGPFAGMGTLHVVYGGKSASATLHVVVKTKEVGAGVDPNAVTALDASGLAQDPSVSSFLYPYDKTLFPLGLATPLVMWTAPKAGDVYKLHYEQNGYAYDGYFVSGAKGQARAAQANWDHLTASNGGDPIKVTLSRYDATSHTAYASASESWSIAPASLRGAIYYWTTSGGGHMSRIRPGTGAQPEVLNGGKCMGCHAVSADGSTLVASVETQPSITEPGGTSKNGSNKRGWVSFDLPAASVRDASDRFSGNVAVNPDGKYTVFGSQTLRLANTQTGAEITGTGIDTVTLDSGMSGLMTPAFSPDGTKLVAVEGAGSWYHNLINGKLVVLDFNETTQKFTNLRGLAAASSFPANERAISYPSFTPDSQSVAFHVGDVPTGCNGSCDDADGQKGSIWLENISGAAPVRLVTLNDSSPKAADHDLSVEPTFNPVERGGYSWVVFTSMRDWGNEITGTANNGKKRLWVAAIDKTGAADPSHPAFYLEGQEENTTNMRGFWALAACTPTKGGGACAAGFECCSGFCDQGQCVDVSQVACKGDGESCSVPADCCNNAVVDCLNGKCTVPVK